MRRSPDRYRHGQQRRVAAAFRAAQCLLEAYQRAQANDGVVVWEDIDMAARAAFVALNQSVDGHDRTAL